MNTPLRMACTDLGTGTLSYQLTDTTTGERTTSRAPAGPSTELAWQPLHDGCLCMKPASRCPVALGATCPGDGEPLSRHIGGKPCNMGTGPSSARSLYDLPIAAWAWREDGAQLRA